MNSNILNKNVPSFRRNEVSSGSGAWLRNYAAAEDLELQCSKVLGRFNRLVAKVNSKKDLSLALSFFWESFLLILHPFENGNGRTAKAIVEETAKQFGYKIESYAMLDRVFTQDPLKQRFYIQISFFDSLRKA